MRSAPSAFSASQRKMRVQQLWHWIYVRGAQDFAEMTSISKDMRGALDAAFHAGAARGGGRADFQRRHPQMAAAAAERATRREGASKSSASTFRKPTAARCAFPRQVGCTLNCSFCHTGTQRLVRNLTAGEIVGQIMVARDRLSDSGAGTARLPTGRRALVTNVVMMGMGEPLYNFEAVRDALLIVVGR